MKKMKWIAGALALALLAGCQGGGVAAADDVAYQAANIRRDMELVTVDGKPITGEEYLFWLNNAVEMQMRYYNGAEADWTEVGEDGLTLADTVKADALETAKLWRVIATKAEELGVVLTDEEEEQVKQELDTVAAQSGGEEQFQTRLAEMCISREGFLGLNRIYYLNQGIRAKLEENGELAVTPEELETYLEESGLYAAKHILISTRHLDMENRTFEEYSDEEKAQALQKAQDLRKQLSDAGDDEALFDQLMNEYSEDTRGDDGTLSYPNGYTYIQPNQMVPEFEQGAKGVEVGQISDVIQSDYGYHIILRIPVEGAEEGCADQKFAQMTQDWIDQAEVVTTKAYDELDPKAFYEKLQAINTARAEAQAAESAAPSETPAQESGMPAQESEAAS